MTSILLKVYSIGVINRPRVTAISNFSYLGLIKGISF